MTLNINFFSSPCWSLEPKLPDFVSVCSNVLLRSSVQLLHPNSRCNTHRQRTGSTTRVERQVDSLSHLRVNRIRTQLCRIPTVAEPVSGSVPRLASHVGRTFHVGCTFHVCCTCHVGQQRPPDFSPDGCSSCLSVHSSRDDAHFHFLSFPFPPFLPPLVLARASTSMGVAPDPCTCE